MYLETDSPRLKFQIEGIEAENLVISFFSESCLDLIFENKKEMDEFLKKLYINKSDSNENYVLITKSFLSTETKLKERQYHLTTEKAEINNYKISNELILFNTNKGEVKLFINKDLIEKIKSELNDINWSINN